MIVIRQWSKKMHVLIQRGHVNSQKDFIIKKAEPGFRFLLGKDSSDINLGIDFNFVVNRQDARR